MSPPLPSQGRFYWLELATRDRLASQRFYRDICGWNWREQDLGDFGTYPMFGVGTVLQGGLVAPKPAGSAAHWMAYVTVNDLDAAIAAAPRTGGQVVVGPTRIPDIGRFAVVKDPRGAVILPFESTRPLAPESPRPIPPGYFCWHELLTDDPEACVPFYEALFDWRTEVSEMPGLGRYWIFLRGDRMECGMLSIPEGATAQTPAHWLPYVAVADINTSIARAENLEAIVYCPPTDIPGFGRYAVLADPQYAEFAVFQAVPQPSTGGDPEEAP